MSESKKHIIGVISNERIGGEMVHTGSITVGGKHTLDIFAAGNQYVPHCMHIDGRTWTLPNEEIGTLARVAFDLDEGVTERPSLVQKSFYETIMAFAASQGGAAAGFLNLYLDGNAEKLKELFNFDLATGQPFPDDNG